ncbi:MAG: hypothetical protein ACUVSK_08810 [Desulfotomaculales bacterium]
MYYGFDFANSGFMRIAGFGQGLKRPKKPRTPQGTPDSAGELKPLVQTLQPSSVRDANERIQQRDQQSEGLIRLKGCPGETA